MSPKVFIGSSTIDALLQIRTELGPDAIVLSTREVSAGVEVVAASRSEASQLFDEIGTQSRSKGQVQRKTSGADRASVQEASSTHGIDASQLSELFRDVQRLVSGRLSSEAWDSIQDSSKDASEALRILLQCGFSSELCGELVDEIRSHVDSVTGPITDHLQKLLENRIATVDPLLTLDSGGIFALVGPTGVGKTTLIAKIAARCALRFGRENVSILTTDNFRIGAYEQLRTYGKIIGVPVTAVKDGGDLSALLADRSEKKVTLIDTAGVSQRDVQMLEQLSMLGGATQHTKFIAVVSATTNLLTVDEVFRLHQLALERTGATGLHSVVITKTDEAGQIGAVIDSIIRHKLPVFFIGTGQHVPDDLSFPNSAYLAYRALTPQPSGKVGEVLEPHVPVLLRDQLSAWARR